LLRRERLERQIARHAAPTGTRRDTATPLTSTAANTAHVTAAIAKAEAELKVQQARLEQVLASVSADKANEPGTVGNAMQVAIDQANAKLIGELERVFSTTTPAQQKAADDLAAAAGQFGQWVAYLPGSINVTFAAPEVNA